MTKHLTASEINDACEAAFGVSADMFDLRVFDFSRLIEATVSIRERGACIDACEEVNVETIVGASEDYLAGRAAAVQRCVSAVAGR